MSWLPTSERNPAVRQRVLLQKDPGLIATDRSIALIHSRLSTASSDFDNLAVEVTSRADAQARYGAGSPLDHMVREAIQSGRIASRDTTPGGSPKLYCIAVPPPAGVATVHTLTVTGPATGAGELGVEIGDRGFTLSLQLNDSANDIAAAIKAGIDELGDDCAYTATVLTNVVTITARIPGEWGNGLVIVIDDTNAPGVSVAEARTVVGTGVPLITDALDETLNIPLLRAIVAPADSTNNPLVKTHVVGSRDYDVDGWHCSIQVMEESDISDAVTEAEIMNDWAIMLGVAEKFAGSGTTFNGRTSARSLAPVLAASLASRLFSQARPNYNFNRAVFSGKARPGKLLNSTINDAINGGVSVLSQDAAGNSIVIDPVTTAIYDQTTPGSTVSDKRWQPFEVFKTVQELIFQMRAILDKYVKADNTLSTLASAKADGLTVLRQAEALGWITDVSESSVTVEAVINGGSTVMDMELNFSVVTGIDIVAVTQKVSRK